MYIPHIAAHQAAYTSTGRKASIFRQEPGSEQMNVRDDCENLRGKRRSGIKQQYLFMLSQQPCPSCCYVYSIVETRSSSHFRCIVCLERSTNTLSHDRNIFLSSSWEQSLSEQRKLANCDPFLHPCRQSQKILSPETPLGMFVSLS